jgi:superfamily I DNA/RNA helicase
MSRSEVRQAESRHASRLRNEPPSPRDDRKNRLSSGRQAIDEGLQPESNAVVNKTENVEATDTGDVKVTSLSSGSEPPYTKGAAINGQMYKKMPPRSNYDYSQDGKIIPTEEQQMAIDAVMTGDDVVVSALAGTGKTSTLIAIAKRMEREQPDKKLVYIVFNKSAASDAERRLAGLKNIEVRTQDSMSWRWAFDRPNGKRQVSRLNFNSKDTPAWLKKNTADELVRGFKIKAIKDGDKEFDAEKIALLARNAVDEFEKSGDKTIGFQHFINADDELIRKEDLPSNILSVANAIWDDRNSDTGKFAISNNTLTKQMQLSEMDFASGSWYRSQGKPGLVMYDEAQDFNPVWTAISKAQNNVQQVFVGDSNQAIYGFRGAKNEMDSMAERADYVLPLTEVFRFNQEIAGPGNRVLSVLGNKTNRMIGRGNPKGKLVEPGSMENPTLILNRTNRGVISECIDALEKGKKVATTQNAMNELTQIINSFSRLYGRESRGGMEHKALEEFQNIDELKKAIAEGTATKKAESLYKLFSSTGFETLNRVKRDVKVAKLDGGDKVSDAEIIASAKAKIAKRPNDFLSSVVSQFEKRGSLSPKQWAALEKNTGLSRAGEEHDVLIMTGHLAKGLESPRVKMGGDWWGPQKKKLEDGTEVVEWPDEQHMNGVYVAMTRATEELDIGSADWIYDWSSDEDALPNTSRGLSSGRSKRTQGKLAKRRPWSEEERQAFADGQRERAQTIPGKRREGPSASEFGSRAARNERRLSSGYSGGAVVGDSEENRLKNERVDNPINMRRRSAMGTSGGIGQFSGKSQTKKKSTPFAGGDVNPEFSKALEAATGTSGRWTPQTGTLDTNRQFDGKTPWMVPAAKLRELFKDENGKQLSDDEILRSLGFSSRNADTLGKEIIDAMDNPRGGISENDAQSLLQALNPDKEDAIQDEMRKIWGFDAAPGWTRRDSTSPITREEFDSLSEKERAKLIPDFGDFINYEPVSVAKPQPKAQTEPARKAGESSRLSLKEVVARSTDSAPTYSADVLAKHLGLIKDDEKIANAATAARVAGDFKKYGITVNPDTLRKWSHDGVPTEALAFLQDTGKISSVSEIYGSRYAAFDELPSKNVVKRKVFDTLKENGMSDEQAIAAMKRVFKAGTVHDELIKAEEKRAKQAAGEIPFTPTGSAQKYDRAELEGFAKSIADEIEKAKKKSGQQGERPEIDVDKTFGIKKIEDIAEPVARESKPNTVNPVKEAPAVVKSESLDKAAIRKLTDEEIKNAIEELLVVANPVVIKNKKTEELEFPDGIRPSDERSVRARRITTLLENEADRRSMTKSAWIGASIRTKGARSQRYKVIDSIDTK